MPPPVPAGTIAALAVTLPSKAFNVETLGGAPPAGHSVRKLSIPGGTTVAFSEYACAVTGAPHPLDGTVKDRVCAAAMEGPPNGPAAFRVSATRHGVAV